MDLRKLEAFLIVANTGKYTDAADKLFISQSSLSKQMAQMERELGVKLFKKTRNGVELTQAGFDFYSYVRKMLPEYHRAVDRLQMYREGGTYPLRIGSLPLAEEYGFANAFSSYWARNTSVQIDYFERSQEDLIDKLDRHKIDLALLRVDMLDPDKYSYVPLVLDEIVIACSTKRRALGPRTCGTGRTSQRGVHPFGGEVRRDADFSSGLRKPGLLPQRAATSFTPSHAHQGRAKQYGHHRAATPLGIDLPGRRPCHCVPKATALLHPWSCMACRRATYAHQSKVYRLRLHRLQRQ